MFVIPHSRDSFSLTLCCPLVKLTQMTLGFDPTAEPTDPPTGSYFKPFSRSRHRSIPCTMKLLLICFFAWFHSSSLTLRSFTPSFCAFAFHFFLCGWCVLIVHLLPTFTFPLFLWLVCGWCVLIFHSLPTFTFPFSRGWCDKWSFTYAFVLFSCGWCLGRFS